MYRVIERKELVPNIHLLVLESGFIHTNARAGEFVVVRADEPGERIPLNLVDWDTKSVSMVFMEVGTSTRKLAGLKAGDEVSTLVGPLGKPTEMVEDKNIVCVGGCYGIGALYPVIRAFKERGNRVTTIIEGRNKTALYWQDKLKKFSDQLHQITRDGSAGKKGHIDTFLGKYLTDQPVDLVYGQGCTYLTYLISETTRPLGVKTVVGLNPVMVDATGMCGVCRVIVDGQMKFACVDGPEFNGHQVDWPNLLARRHTYISEERMSLSFYECEKYG
jgi:ferredoxin--NADP+ reductase